MAGNIADVRFVKGTAVYTSNFTPPTAPLSAITNTKLLVQVRMQVLLIRVKALEILHYLEILNHLQLKISF